MSVVQHATFRYNILCRERQGRKAHRVISRILNKDDWAACVI